MIHPAAISPLPFGLQSSAPKAMHMVELTRRDFKFWGEYEPMDWQHWVRKLPNGGDGITGFTRQEWRQWVDMLYHLHKTAEPISACSENKHKCKRKRTEDVSPQAPTQREKVHKFNIFSSTPAQGPPAQGHTALSKDIAP